MTTTLRLSDLAGPDANGFSDVAVFVFDDGTESELFILDYHRGSGSYIRYAHNASSLPGSETTPVRRLGRGRLVPARIEMEGETTADLAEQVQRLREVLVAVIETGLNGGNNVRLSLLAAKQTGLDDDDLAHAEQSEAAVQRARAVLAATAPTPTEDRK